VNFSHDIHPSDNLAKRRETLAVGMSRAANIQRWLVANANEKAGAGGVRRPARH
jgi:hypothetical protein